MLLFLYLPFRNGQLLSVTRSNSYSPIDLLNPWTTYAKAAAHGALGNAELAAKYAYFLPFTFLQMRLAKYLGHTQPHLVRTLLGKPTPSNHLRIAFELVSGTSAEALSPPTFPKPNPLMQALWGNRTAACAADRVPSINAVLQATGGSSVQWLPEGVFKLAFTPPPVSPASTAEEGCLVTVVVTAYNVGTWVRQSLQSLLNQTHRHLQILVANDASTDDTHAHLVAMAQQDARITVFNIPDNIGTYAAKALMLRFAKGEHLVCHDADDLAAPNLIERSLHVLLTQPRKAAVISNWFRVDEELRIFPGAVRRFWPLLSINHSSLMLRTADLKALGGWDVPRVAADTELYERIRMVHGKRAVVHLSEPLTIGSMRTDSLMNDTHLGAIQAQAFRRRVEYREAWVDWHHACQKQRTAPVMPSPLSADRPFCVPEALKVDPAAIARCWEAMLAQHSL